MRLVPVLVVLVACIDGMIVADDQCEFESLNQYLPGTSCEDIYKKNPRVRNESGDYWIIDGPRYVYCGMNYTGQSCEKIYNNNPETVDKNGYYRINTQWTYCNMTAIAAGYFNFSCAGVGGEWRRIARFDISAGDECPTGWNKRYYSGVSFCRTPSNTVGCYSTSFSTNAMNYIRVCGRARGYQKGSPDGFLRVHPQNNNIEMTYVDGLSITHGSPPQHIWTYAVGHTERDTAFDVAARCPCTVGRLGRRPPSFVGYNYYCESGAETENNDFLDTYFLSDPLWDGSGCFSGNSCCSNTTLPWFQYQLSEMTHDDIEMRICRDENFSNEEILIDILELYIQ